MKSRASARRRDSFTLVELLVVMAIVAILIALAVPSITSLFEGDGLSTGAQQVADQVNLARQLSSSKNVTVELRVFKMAGTNASYSSGGFTSGYTALQMGTNDSTGQWQAVSRLYRLPQNIVISEKTTFSFMVIPARYATQTALTGIKNYAIVQINPVTGTPLVFRP
jgi:uncharacterized protein (TIGR02596 family)